ncbi:MAG: trigger factor [Candidatus Coatesbacteria bacterium]
MKYSRTEEQSCKQVFRVELDGHEWSHAREWATRGVAEQAHLPGFRKGKVPPQVLEGKFGKQIEEEALEHAIGHAARTVLEETKLEPVVNPSVSNVQRSEQGMVFLLTIELAPQIVLGSYTGLSFVRETVEIRPEDIDAVVESLRRRYATYAAAERPARWGDLAVIDYEGTVDGQPFEGGSVKDVVVFIGSGEAMRDLEQALVGRSAGDAFLMDLEYPKDHANAAVAGKTAKLAVSLKEVKVGKPPDLGEDFARTVGGFASMEVLRAEIRSKLAAEKEHEIRERLKATVVDRLLRFAPAQVAPSLVEEETRMMAVRGAEQLARGGVQRLDQLRTNPDGFKNMFKPAAIRAVREAFVLEAIARKEAIEVSDEELDREIRKGDREGEITDATVATLKRDGRWDRLRARLRQDRTLDFVIGAANVTERAICL